MSGAGFATMNNSCFLPGVRMRRSSLLVLILATCSLVLSGCSRLPRAAKGPRVVSPGSVAALVGPERCVPFQWVAMPGLSDRYLIRVPVQIAGKQRWYQLDTGAFRSHIYLDSADSAKRSWAMEREEGRQFTRAALSVGDVTIPDARLQVHGKRRSRLAQSVGSLLGLPVLDGTLGLEAISGRILVIDYPEQRLCLLQPDHFPAELERRAEWVPADMRNNHFFIRPTINGEPSEGLFFDTGASLFPLSVDYMTWKRLTGRTGEEPDNRRLTVNAWGEQVPLIGAPALGAMQVGSVHLDRPMIYYSPTRPDHYAQWAYPVTGTVGNAPFWDHVVIMDACTGSPRFGISDKHDAGACTRIVRAHLAWVLLPRAVVIQSGSLVPQAGTSVPWPTGSVPLW